MEDKTKYLIDSQVLKEFEIVQLMGEGGSAVVWKAIHKRKMILVAIKKWIKVWTTPATSQRVYREIEIISRLQGHDNIASFYEVIESSDNKDLYLVFNFVQSDLERVIKARILKEPNMDYIIFKLLKSVLFAHSKGVVHRDIKPSNILINSNSEIFLADFGLSRTVARDLSDTNGNEAKGVTDIDNMEMTAYVASRWYRAPEILLGSLKYSYASDIWSIGWIFGEMLLGRVLFQGSSSLNQLERIFEVVGRPTDEDLADIGSPYSNALISAVETKHRIEIEKLFMEFPESLVSLISSLLILNPKKRISAMDALKHRYISYLLVDEPDLPTRYQSEEKIILELDDNKLYKIKNYQEWITDFIEHKTLKKRRIQCKNKQIGKEIERYRKIQELKNNKKRKNSDNSSDSDENDRQTKF